MKGKEDLFELIRAMSPSEKRYFTLDAKKSGRKASRYLKLFQLVNDMEVYDEAVLRARYPRSLPFDKGYLYDAILRSMRDYRSSKSRYAQIKERLLDARYLFEHGLYDQCEVRLEEGCRLAEELDDHLSLLELNREFRRLAPVTKRPGYEEYLRDCAAREQDLLELIGEEGEYLGLYEQLATRVIREFALREESQRTAFLAKFPAVRLEQPPQTAPARLRYHQCRALFHQLLGDFEQVMAAFSDVLDWWEAHPKYKEEEYHGYIIDMSNLLHAYITNGQGHLLPQLIRQLESAQPDTETARRIHFQKVAIYRLISHINLGLREAIEPLMETIGEGLDKFNIPAATRSALLFNMALLLFTRDRFDDCLLWCGRLIGDRKNAYRQDIRTAIYLLQLAAAYEIGDAQLLEATYRATYRYFQKQGAAAVGSFEGLVLESLRRLMHAAPKEEAAIWTAFRDRLQALHADPGVKVAHGMDELMLLWTRSRLERKEMAEVMGKVGE